MSLKVLFLRGSTAQNNAYTGEDGELTFDVTTRSLRLHDGALAGGYPILGQTQVQALVDAVQADVDTNTGAIATINDTTIPAINAALANKVETSLLGANNGVATLDSNGKVPLAQINDVLLGQVEYKGTWNAGTNTPTLPTDPSGETNGLKGEYYVVSDAGTFATISFEVGDWIISNGTAWEKVDNTDAVSSVAGKTGVVTLDKTDVGLANVDNTSDADKPVSTAQQTALDLKANLASPALTGTPTAPTAAPGTDTTQLATTAFVKAAVDALDTGVSDVQGTAPIVVTGTATKTVSITDATTSASGAMSGADKTKLDGIEAGAQVNTVDSVAGKTGVVTLEKADVGLGNVENYGIATQQQSEDGESNVVYATPQSIRWFVEGMGFVQDGQSGEWTLDQGTMS